MKKIGSNEVKGGLTPVASLGSKKVSNGTKGSVKVGKGKKKY